MRTIRTVHAKKYNTFSVSAQEGHRAKGIGQGVIEQDEL